MYFYTKSYIFLDKVVHFNSRSTATIYKFLDRKTLFHFAFDSWSSLVLLLAFVVR
jgi:hypothetical protein